MGSSSRPSDQLDENCPLAAQRTRLAHPSVRRWGQVLLYTLLGALAFDLVLPWARRFARDQPTQYTATLQEWLFWLCVFLLFFFAAQPIRLPRRQFRQWHRYPPIWFVVPLGLFLAGVREQWLPSFGLQGWGVEVHRSHSFPIAWIATALALGAVLVRHLQGRQQSVSAMSSEAPSLDNVTPDSVEQWIAAHERPLENHEPEFFGHRSVARKIVHLVGQEGRAVALVGAFGTGKSSILKAVCAELNDRSPRTVCAWLDVWTVPNAEDVPRLALRQMIRALDDLVDTIELSGMPDSYKRLAAAEPTGWLARTLSGDPTDSLQEMERLSPILDAIDAKVVLMVEDVERTGEGFDTRHLERFLWALRRLERCTFVVAVDARSRLDFLKLSDTIELVPSVRVEHVERILRAAYKRWTTKYSDIDPIPHRNDSDPFQFRTTTPNDLPPSQLQAVDWVQPQLALMALLQTPRELKHTIRRVDRVWSNLHGEAELDHILILFALRHGAPEAYKFLLANIDRVREDSTQMGTNVEPIKKDWEKLLSRLPNGPAVQRLVNLLGVEQLKNGPPQVATLSRQGIHIQRPVDYFARVAAEELDSNELRDQEVLRHIEQWKNGQFNSLVERLVPMSGVDDHYAQVWSHLAIRPDETALIKLTDLVVDRLLTIHGASASGEHPALLALWVKCGRSLPKNIHAQWLIDLIKRPVPRSLSLVTGLYCYWTGEYGIVDEPDKATIRDAVSNAVRAVLERPDDLVQVLAEEHPAAILDFITALNGPRGYEEWRDCFAPLLIGAAKDHGDLILPELAILAGDGEIQARRDWAVPLPFFSEYKIDRERMAAFFRGQLDEALTLLSGYDGANPHLLRAKDDAKAWLSERASGGSKS